MTIAATVIGAVISANRNWFFVRPAEMNNHPGAALIAPSRAAGASARKIGVAASQPEPRTTSITAAAFSAQKAISGRLKATMDSSALQKYRLYARGLSCSALRAGNATPVIGPFT
jgi:hypothetical protein